ncbi:hypothetical protein BDFB_007696 [Asbolus verrucosus]|uniref:Dynein regulatory complex subunit 2 n=1 Tax=Asbolus verrucosus TaxID=1661398 RepID=A0A482W2E1_ASBVE|nr:hypothetical protein BDFB_007696 [Asbolus verrucosus]
MPKPKLTPEERKELKKQKKLEKQQRKEETKRQIQRDHFRREIQYGELIYRKHEKEWRRMLMKVTLPRMREELEYAWHSFERVIDNKDFTISLLMDEIKDAEEQYMHNFRNHLENVDKLVARFSDRLADFKIEYGAGVQKLQNKCDSDVENMRDVNKENMNYLKTMLYKLELEKRQQERITRAEYFSRLDEVEVKNQLLLQKLKAHLEKKYQTIFENMHSFIANYIRQQKERKKEYKEYKIADDAIQELISLQVNQMKKLYDTLRHLRQKFRDVKQSTERKLVDLQAERQYFAQSYRLLKTHLANDQETDFTKMANLSRMCAGIYNDLEKLKKKGETILKIAAICRKMETQKEKILAFPKDDVKIFLKIQLFKDEEEEEDTKGIIKEMRLFWERIGQAYGVYYALKREKAFLVEENQLFIDTHNAYCEKLAYPTIKNYRRKTAITKTDVNMETGN